MTIGYDLYSKPRWDGIQRLLLRNGFPLYFKHFQGKHRSNKAEWQSAIEKEGFIGELRQQSRELLDESEHRYLWDEAFSTKAFFPTETVRYRLWRRFKQLLYGGSAKP